MTILAIAENKSSYTFKEKDVGQRWDTASTCLSVNVQSWRTQHTSLYIRHRPNLCHNLYHGRLNKKILSHPIGILAVWAYHFSEPGGTTIDRDNGWQGDFDITAEAPANQVSNGIRY